MTIRDQNGTHPWRPRQLACCPLSQYQNHSSKWDRAIPERVNVYPAGSKKGSHMGLTEHESE
ncbi:hypothetical protein PO909_020628 [Leuciscus waleckii]